MADSSVARSDRDILELNVHVVFSYNASPSTSLFAEKLDRGYLSGRTFEQFATIDLARCDLESNDMALQNKAISSFLVRSQLLEELAKRQGGV
jgi:hypothetical protein